MKQVFDIYESDYDLEEVAQRIQDWLETHKAQASDHIIVELIKESQ